ncbi:hypothetical protein MKX03_021432 [Papaver bracteatum]|nr:hypothetical protein MKX03_021432 [Papaver bracteatum]
MDKSYPLSTTMVVRTLNPKRDPFRPKEEGKTLLGQEVPYLSAIGGLLYLEDASPPTILLRLGAGSCAGIVAMSATYPMDLVKGRLTVQTDVSPFQYRGIAHTLSTVLREEGLRGLYKGWLPSVVGVVPCIGLNFAVYGSLKEWLVKYKPLGLVNNNNSELSIPARLMCGAVAGTVGPTIFYPLDVIRRRMQMVGWNNASSVITGEGCSKASPMYTGMIDAFRKTVRNEGLGALYKGLVPNLLKVVPSVAIAFVSYETVKDILGV